jgi:hypothetical protein
MVRQTGSRFQAGKVMVQIDTTTVTNTQSPEEALAASASSNFTVASENLSILSRTDKPAEVPGLLFIAEIDRFLGHLKR